MLYLENSLISAISNSSTTIAWCWQIERKDGTQFNFTSCDRDIYMPPYGEIYRASTGFDPTSAAQKIGSDTDSQQLGGFLINEAISSKDLLAGLFNGAKIRAFLVDVQNPDNNQYFQPLLYIPVFSGIIATVSKNDRFFEFAIKGIEDLLNNQIGIVTSKFCRANFGDSVCQKDLNQLTHLTSVIELSSQPRRFKISGSWNANYFTYGKLTYLNGENAGKVTDIFYQDSDGWITLYEAPTSLLTLGDTLELVAGCPKTWYSCVRYGNWVNFDGEPHVPLPEDRQNIKREDV